MGARPPFGGSRLPEEQVLRWITQAGHMCIYIYVYIYIYIYTL